MKRFIQVIITVIICGILASIFIPSVTSCGTSYVKVHTFDRGTFITTTGISIGDWLGHDVYEPELIEIIENYIDRDKGWKIPNPFAPNAYKIGSTIDILIQIKNEEVKELCIRLLNDPEFGKRAPGYLVKLGDKSVTPYIIEAMRDAEGSDFVYLGALSQLKEPRAIPLIIEKFGDGYMQESSAKNLLKMIEQMCGEELPQFYSNRWNSRLSSGLVRSELEKWWAEYRHKHSIDGFVL